MEEETESCGNCDKGLLKFRINDASDDVFDIRADVGVEVLSELGGCSVGEDTYREKKGTRGYSTENMESTHFLGNTEREKENLRSRDTAAHKRLE